MRQRENHKVSRHEPTLSSLYIKFPFADPATVLPSDIINLNYMAVVYSFESLHANGLSSSHSAGF